VERLQYDLAQYAKGQQGQVRLLCNTAALTEYLPELLAQYLVEYPGVSVDVQELPSLRIVQAITQGMADLGIVSTAAPSEHLQTRPFRDDPLVLVMPQGHPWPVRWRPFRRQPHGYVGLGAGSALALHLEEQALHEGQRMQVRVRAEGFDGVIRMVAGGAGVGVVPLASVQRWQGMLPLHWVALQEPWANRRLQVCARDFAALPGYAAGLVSTLAH
jgi:DNA-binding transcriptional LysR family regulator